MISKVKGGFVVISHKTRKRLSKLYKKIEGAQKRLRQIQFFKHKKGDG